MNRIIFILLCVCCVYDTKAQPDLYVPWRDSLSPPRSLRGISHMMDEQGNTYALCNVNVYVNISRGMPLEGTYCYGSAILKIDKDNKLIWKRLYEVSGGGSIGIGGRVPATQLFIKGDSIILPYNIDIGMVSCMKNSFNGATRNGFMAIDRSTGAILKNEVFNEGMGCQEYHLLLTAFQKNGNLSYLYSNVTWDSFYVNVRDAGLGFVSTSSYNNVKGGGDFNIGYDELAGQYMTGDTSGAHIYDTGWQLLRSLPLPYMDSFPWKPNIEYNFAANDAYYAINYYNVPYPPKYAYTAIFTRGGKLVSCTPSAYVDIALDDDNNLYGVSYPYDPPPIQTSDSPVIFTQTDLFQNVKRRIRFGKPNTKPMKIRVNDGDIVVTGTHSKIGAPDELYYYRQHIANIPLLINDSKLCTAIHIYPNPTTGRIKVSSDDFNLAYGANIEIYNTLGQKITNNIFDSKTLSFDLTNYPPSIYLLKIRNGNASCVTKIEKQ